MLEVQVNASVSWRDIGVDTAGREVIDPNALNYVRDLTNGTGLNQCDLLFYERHTLLAAGSRVYNFDGTETNRRGESLTFVRVKAIVVANLTETDGLSLTVGGGTEPLANWITVTTAGVIVAPGGCLKLINPSATGYGVTSSNDRLRVLANAGTTTYDIVLLGCSA